MNVDKDFAKIDLAAFKLVSLISKKPTDARQEWPAPEMVGLGKIMDIKLPEDYTIGETDARTGETVSKYSLVKGGYYGLGEPIYRQFNEEVLRFLQYRPFSSWCEEKFLTDHAFKWLLEIFDTGKAERSISDHLLEVLENEAKDHEFHFHIVPLEIEKEFIVGNMEFMYFTSDELASWQELYLKERPGSEKEFKELERTTLTGVFGKVNAKGVKERALQKAIQHASLSVDALKCLFINEAVTNHFEFFDLAMRFRPSALGKVLALRKEPFEFIIHFRGACNRVPLSITQSRLSEGFQKGLDKIGRFLSMDSQTELAIEIKRFIGDFAEVLSTADHHEKIVRTIRLMESVVIPREGSGRSKGEKRIKEQLISRMVASTSRKMRLQNVIRGAYEIRDKFLHNAQRLSIEHKRLFDLLDFQRVLLLQLIELQQSMTTIDEVLEWINQPPT